MAAVLFDAVRGDGPGRHVEGAVDLLGPSSRHSGSRRDAPATALVSTLPRNTRASLVWGMKTPAPPSLVRPYSVLQDVQQAPAFAVRVDRRIVEGRLGLVALLFVLVVREEEERLVALDRPAERSAELVLAEVLVLGAVGVLAEQRAVAAEVERRCPGSGWCRSWSPC